MFSNILGVDKEIFHFVNGKLTSTNWDWLMVLVSGTTAWLIGAVLFVVICIFYKKWSYLKIFLLAIIVLVVADYFAYNLFKPMADRLRPCKELPYVRLVVETGCGGWYSFPSNHATNSMVLATFGIIFGSRLFGALLFTVALVIGFSRVYLGAHYPLDIMAGFFFGGTLAAIVSLILKKRAGYFGAKSREVQLGQK